MAVVLPDDDKKQALASLNRYCTEVLAADLGEIEVASLLEFFLREIAPSVHNAAVNDAQTYLRDRVADLEGACYEPEFAFWPKSASVRRK